MMLEGKPCPTCTMPDPWHDWRERFHAEQIARRLAEGRVKHLEACLRKLAAGAERAVGE